VAEKKHKILVAAHGQGLRENLERLLKELGHQVEVAGNGQEAWDKVQQEKYDALCTDLYLSRKSGFELIAQIRHSDSLAGLPCLVVSSSRTQAEISRAVQAGASDYLTMPVNGQVLAARLEGALEARVPLMSAIYSTSDPEKLYHIAHHHVTQGYDFKHPARINKTQLRTLENLHDNFARLLSSTFSGAMRAVVDVDTAFVDQTTHAEFIMSLSNPSCSYQFTLGPTSGQVVLDIAMPVAFAFVDRIFGGKGSSQGVEARQVTPIEMRVINRIVKRVIEDLEATWEPILRVEITDIELETNPEFIRITAPNEIVILLAFEVNSTNASGLVSVCYPFFTLEPVLPRLGQQTYARRSAQDLERLRLENRLRLGPMDLPLVAELGRTRVKLGQAQALQEGDIVRLPARASDPVPVFLGGRPKFLARPFVEQDGELKLKIVGQVPGDQQGRYGKVEVYSQEEQQEGAIAPGTVPQTTGASAAPKAAQGGEAS
jgi:flagellar motor switch protein FliM